jgi:hypothetical protein
MSLLSAGGWHPISEDTYTYWGAHFLSRLVFAVRFALSAAFCSTLSWQGPYAVFVLILGVFLARAHVQNQPDAYGLSATFTYGRAARLAVAVFFVTHVSLFVGWGCYFAVGEDASNPSSIRTGVFDWLIGRRQVLDPCTEVAPVAIPLPMLCRRTGTIGSVGHATGWA